MSYERSKLKECTRVRNIAGFHNAVGFALSYLHPFHQDLSYEIGSAPLDPTTRIHWIFVDGRTLGAIIPRTNYEVYIMNSVIKEAETREREINTPLQEMYDI